MIYKSVFIGFLLLTSIFLQYLNVNAWTKNIFAAAVLIVGILALACYDYFYRKRKKIPKIYLLSALSTAILLMLLIFGHLLGISATLSWFIFSAIFILFIGLAQM
jgi:nitrate reductase gamma subunit